MSEIKGNEVDEVKEETEGTQGNNISNSETKDGKKQKRNRAKPNRPYPIFSIEEALKIPLAVKNLNGGNPWSPTDIANALDIKPKTNPYYYLTAASRDYGFTIGTRDTDKIELDSLGKGIVYAQSEQQEEENVIKAFQNVKIFKDVYNHYSGQALPELKYLKNTLETEFKLVPELHDEFYKVYQENVQYINNLKKTDVKDDKKQKASNLTVIIAEPSHKTSAKAFVIMPFVEKTDRYSKGFFDEVLKSLIMPAAVEAGFKVETAKRDGSDIIQSTIINDLLDADLVITDLTEHNPNVLFELGLRIAFEKPVALIRAAGTAQIFDVDNMLRVYNYNPNLWRSTLEADIPKLVSHIKATWENREKMQTYLNILKQRSQ